MIVATSNPKDCICGGAIGDGSLPRLAIVCPCCDGVVRVKLPLDIKTYRVKYDPLDLTLWRTVPMQQTAWDQVNEIKF